MHVPFEKFEKYYDVNEVDDQGKYKAWLLGIEKYEAVKRIHHFIPFSTKQANSVPKWSEKHFNFSYNPTANVSLDQSPKSSSKSPKLSKASKSNRSKSPKTPKSPNSSSKRPRKKSPHNISKIIKREKEQEE